jgi:hypothetical protein
MIINNNPNLNVRIMVRLCSIRAVVAATIVGSSWGIVAFREVPEEGSAGEGEANDMLASTRLLDATGAAAVLSCGGPSPSILEATARFQVQLFFLSSRPTFEHRTFQFKDLSHINEFELKIVSSVARSSLFDRGEKRGGDGWVSFLTIRQTFEHRTDHLNSKLYRP